MEKLAQVREYSCVVETTDLRTLGNPGNEWKVEFGNHCEQRFRRPNLMRRRCVQLKHALPETVDMVTVDYFDGTIWWQLAHPAVGSGKRLADKRRIPAGPQRQQLIQSFERDSVYQYVLEDLRSAGLDRYAGGVKYDPLLRPFRDCNLTTLSLKSETDDIWIFTAEPLREWPLSKRYVSITLTIGKADGAIRDAYYDEGDRGYRSVTVSDVRVNPSFSDSEFVFVPPEGLTVRDGTEYVADSLVSACLRSAASDPTAQKTQREAIKVMVIRP